MDIARTVAALRRHLAAQGTAERAAQEQRYLKSQLTFLGVTMPVIRREAAAFARAHAELDRAGLRALASALWATEVHELRSFAVALLERRVALLKKGDATWLLGFVREAKTWAHVDWLATKVLGALLAREPSLAGALDRWAKDPDFWVRRTALLALHDPLLQGNGDFERFARLATPLLSEPEFFMRKAIGWVLRSTSKRTPALTYGYVKQHAAAMSGLTFREAVKHLPAGQQKELRTLRG